MKDKFIRVISPFTAGMVLLLDIAVIFYFNYLIQKLHQKLDVWNVLFIIIEIIAIIIAVATSIEVLKNGVKFDNEKIEFTAIDNDNVFKYCDIDHIESSKDTKASLRKNFVDRYSNIIFYMKDGNIATITLGLTTNKTLQKIVDEINNRIDN